MFYSAIPFSVLLAGLTFISTFAHAGLENDTDATEQAGPSSAVVSKTKAFFGEQEDAILKQIVEQASSHKRTGGILWALVERLYNEKIKVNGLTFPFKNKKQLRERYSNYLASGIQDIPWTQEEDCFLRSLVVNYYLEHGPLCVLPWSTWAQKSFPGRSPQFLKNKYSTVLFRQELYNVFMGFHKLAKDDAMRKKHAAIVEQVCSQQVLNAMKPKERAPRYRSAPKRVAVEARRPCDVPQQAAEQSLLLMPQEQPLGFAGGGISLEQLQTLLSSDAGFNPDDGFNPDAGFPQDPTTWLFSEEQDNHVPLAEPSGCFDK